MFSNRKKLIDNFTRLISLNKARKQGSVKKFFFTRRDIFSTKWGILVIVCPHCNYLHEIFYESEHFNYRCRECKKWCEIIKVNNALDVIRGSL